MCSRMQLLLLATSSIRPGCCSDVLRESTLNRFQSQPHPPKINGLKSGERGVQVVAPASHYESGPRSVFGAQDGGRS